MHNLEQLPGGPGNGSERSPLSLQALGLSPSSQTTPEPLPLSLPGGAAFLLFPDSRLGAGLDPSHHQPHALAIPVSEAFPDPRGVREGLPRKATGPSKGVQGRMAQIRKGLCRGLRSRR